LILALVLSALVTTTAQAQAPTSNVDRWDAGLLTDMLHSLAAKDVRVSLTDGRPALEATSREGLALTLLARGCDTPVPASGEACHAIEGLVTFDLSQTPNRAVIADQLNHGFAMGKFTIEPNGALRVTRYVLLDGGVSQDNLRQQLIDFIQVAALTRQTIWPQTAH
jgi:hypothetical protein